MQVFYFILFYFTCTAGLRRAIPVPAVARKTVLNGAEMVMGEIEASDQKTKKEGNSEN